MLRLGNKVRLVIPRGIWEELQYMTKKVSPDEVSGLGEIEVGKDGRFRVKRVHLLKQEVTAGDTELDMTEIALLQTEWMERVEEEKTEMKLWWHTHGEANVFWSQMDESTCDRLRESGEWFVSVVMNKTGDVLARVDGTDQFGAYAFEIPVLVESTLTEERKQELRHEIDEKVTKALLEIPAASSFRRQNTLATAAGKVSELASLKTVSESLVCGDCEKLIERRDGSWFCPTMDEVRQPTEFACAMLEYIRG